MFNKTVSWQPVSGSYQVSTFSSDPVSQCCVTQLLHCVAIKLTGGLNLCDSCECERRNCYYCGSDAKQRWRIRQHLLLLVGNDGARARGWRKSSAPKRSRKEHLFLLESVQTCERVGEELRLKCYKPEIVRRFGEVNLTAGLSRHTGLASA